MRLITFCISVFIFTCISFEPLRAEGELITVVTPQDNRLQSELTFNVVIEADKKRIDSIEIITQVEQLNVDLNSSKTTECKSLTLKLGENRISIRSYKDNKLVDEKIRRIYVSSQIHHQYRYPPPQYKQSNFHNEANEAKCSKCHDMRVNEVEGVIFEDVTKSNCHKCHNSITKEKYAHAPSANWLCTSCHSPKKKGELKYSAPEPVNTSCFECHKENEELWNSQKYRHEPLDSGHCTKCHNPHSSPYMMFVRKPVNNICMGCHKDKQIKVSQSEKSVCSGVKEGDLCIKCHNPHASNRAFFLKEAFESGSQ